MNPEIQSYIEGAEQGSSTNDVSAEDLTRVQESESKAKQIAGQIAGAQQQGGQIAKFLTRLLQDLYDEQWFWDNIGLFNVSGLEPFNQTFLYEELVAMLLPFYATEGDEYDLAKHFPIDYHFTRTLPHLTGYYVALTGYYDRIRIMDREKMRAFLLVMLEHYGVIKLEEIEDKSTILGEITG